MNRPIQNRLPTMLQGRYWPLIVAAVGIIAYSNSFLGGFILDDYSAIVGSASLSQFLVYESPTRAVADLTFKLNYAVGGLNVADYHAVNLLIHTMAGLLLFGILRRTLKMARFRSRFNDAADWLAGFCAAIWVAHPLQTQSVTYICQRYESLMGLFFLLTLYAFIRGAEREGDNKGYRGRPRLWYGLSLAACAMGMGVKAVMIGAPLLVWLYDGLFVSKSWREAWKKRGRVHLALFLTWGILAALWLGDAAAGLSGTAEALPAVSSWRYLMTQSQVLLHYIGLSLFPAKLCFVYEWPFVEKLSEVILQMSVLSLAAIATLWGVIRRRSLAYLGAWFFVILGPTSSVVPVNDAAVEHRMYLPLAAVVVGTVLLLYAAVEKGIRTERARTRLIRPVMFGCLLAIGICLAWLTAARNRDYRSQTVMWQDVVDKRPDILIGRLGLGLSLMGEGRETEAQDWLEQVVRDAPDAGRLTDAYRAGLCSKAHLNLGAMCYAASEFKQAEHHFRESMRFAPHQITALRNLGLALKAQGRVLEAMEEWRRVLAQKPEHQLTLHSIASTQSEEGAYREAIEGFEKILKLNADNHAAALEYAGLLATCQDESLRDPERAIELINGVRRATGDRSVMALDVHATALAALGRYGEAAESVRKALKIGESRGVQGLESIEERLKIYTEKTQSIPTSE